MLRIASMIRGPLLVSEDTECSGMIGGDVTVEAGVLFSLSGMVRGDLIVKRDATAIIEGLVGGRVQNRGGYVKVSGLARGYRQSKCTAGSLTG